MWFLSQTNGIKWNNIGSYLYVYHDMEVYMDVLLCWVVMYSWKVCNRLFENVGFFAYSLQHSTYIDIK